MDVELGESVTVLTDAFDVNFLRGRHLRILPLADVTALFLLDVVVLFASLDVELFLLDVEFFLLDVELFLLDVELFDLVDTGASELDADDVFDEPSSETDSMASKTWPSRRFAIDSTILDADWSMRNCSLFSDTDDGRATPAELERFDADLPFFDTWRRLGPFLC